MLTLDYEQVSMSLRSLGPRQTLIYFRGYLDSERLERPRGEASQVADEAMALCRAGYLHLVQRRLGLPMCRMVVDWRGGHGPGFEYIAIGAGRMMSASLLMETAQ